MNRAYSTIEIKALAEVGGKRTFTGIASTIQTDRMDDIVVPSGAVFKLPIALCWQHNTKEPVGWVHAARVSEKQIEVDCEIHNETEPGRLKDRLDEAWQSIKAKLVRGLSIGFNPLESSRIEGTYGLKFLSWEWLELSPVTVPANAGSSITSIKSADQAIRRAAPGARPVVRLDAGTTGKPQPGVSGTKQARRSGVVYLNS